MYPMCVSRITVKIDILLRKKRHWMKEKESGKVRAGTGMGEIETYSLAQRK